MKKRPLARIRPRPDNVVDLYGTEDRRGPDRPIVAVYYAALGFCLGVVFCWVVGVAL